MDWFKTFPVQKPGVVGRVIGSEAVIILPEKAQVKILNELGARVWSLADGHQTIGDIIDIISKEYEVTTQQAETDIVEFIELLVKNEIIQLTENPINAALNSL